MTVEIREDGTVIDHYTIPRVGWVCFHCKEHLTTIGAARDHFGFDQSEDPACRIKIGEERGLVMELRRVQEELIRYRCEDSDMDRKMAGMQADHRAALIRAEQEGYDKGLRDGKELRDSES